LKDFKPICSSCKARYFLVTQIVANTEAEKLPYSAMQGTNDKYISTNMTTEQETLSTGKRYLKKNLYWKEIIYFRLDEDFSKP